MTIAWTKESGARLADARKRAQLTQKDLAGAVGVDPQYLSKVERATESPSPGLRERLAEKLSVTVSYLESGPPPAATTLPAPFDSAKTTKASDPYPGRARLREMIEFQTAPAEVQKDIITWAFVGGDKRSLSWWLHDLQERIDAFNEGSDGTEGTEPHDPDAPRDEKVVRRRDR